MSQFQTLSNLIQTVTLSIEEKRVLAEGLKFIPYKDISENKHHASLDSFNVTLQSYATPFKFTNRGPHYLPNNPEQDCNKDAHRTINLLRQLKLN